MHGQPDKAEPADVVDLLRAQFDPVVPIFVLVDPILGEPFPGDVDGQTLTDLEAQRQAIWQREIVGIDLSPQVWLGMGRFPYLVALHGRDDPLLEQTLEIAQGEAAESTQDGLDGSGRARHAIGGWLQSSALPTGLREAMRLLLLLRTEARTRARYLRLADRRVLALLRHVVGDDCLAQQLGPISRWIYLDAPGDLACLDRTGMAADVPNLRLPLDAWQRMENGESIHRARAMWLGERARHQPDVAARAGIPFSAVERALGLARGAAARWPHRFMKTEDLLAWAVLLLRHPRLGNGEAVRVLLNPPCPPDEPEQGVRELHGAIAQYPHSTDTSNPVATSRSEPKTS